MFLERLVAFLLTDEQKQALAWGELIIKDVEFNAEVVGLLDLAAELSDVPQLPDSQRMRILRYRTRKGLDLVVCWEFESSPTERKRSHLKVLP